jgi:hypothetical protein
LGLGNHVRNASVDRKAFVTLDEQLEGTNHFPENVCVSLNFGVIQDLLQRKLDLVFVEAVMSMLNSLVEVFSVPHC